MTDDAAEHERICLTVVFLAMATIRLVEAPHDERFIDASNSLRKIASTLDEVPDEMILKLATCNIVSEGTLSCTICDSFIVRWARRCTAKNEWLPRGGGSFAHPLVTFNFLDQRFRETDPMGFDPTFVIPGCVPAGDSRSERRPGIHSPCSGYGFPDAQLRIVESLMPRFARHTRPGMTSVAGGRYGPI